MVKVRHAFVVVLYIVKYSIFLRLDKFLSTIKIDVFLNDVNVLAGFLCKLVVQNKKAIVCKKYTVYKYPDPILSIQMSNGHVCLCQ